MPKLAGVKAKAQAVPTYGLVRGVLYDLDGRPPVLVDLFALATLAARADEAGGPPPSNCQDLRGCGLRPGRGHELMDVRYFLLAAMWALFIAGVVIDGVHPLRDAAVAVCALGLTRVVVRHVRSNG